MNTKNNSITLWRILFTYLIMIYHFDNHYLISQHFNLRIGWYIGVEFFFIVSGYLLYTGMEKLSLTCHSGWDYFVYRYKRIYPYYLGAFIFSFIFYVITNKIGLKDMIIILTDNFFECFALHGIGLDVGWSHINNTS